MIERIPNTEKFRDKFDSLVTVYKNAFAGYPWFEDLSIEEVQKRLTGNLSKRGFQAFIAESVNSETAGALWYDTPTLEELASERGQKLADFARTLGQTNNIETIVWEREVLVDPNFQRQGIATKLRTTFAANLEESLPNGSIILTRMRDDNIGIIKVAEKVGYSRTGIKTPSSQTPGVFHEYWYKVIKPLQSV